MAEMTRDITCEECKSEFTVESHRQYARRFCFDCRPARYLYVPKDRDNTPRCQLDGCNRAIPANKHSRAKYCSKKHLRKAANGRAAEKRKVKNTANALFKNPDQEQPISQERQGETYAKINANPVIKARLLSGEITASQAAIMLDCSTAAVTRSMHAMLAEIAIERQRDEWSQSKRVQAMLPAEVMAKAKQMGRDGMEYSHPDMVGLIDELVRAYIVFSRRYFNLEGRRPIIKDFHVRWIRTIIEAYVTGGKRLILSPPRHGKSETLIRFVVWFICMDPNIRIGWFCAGTDVAKLMLGAVKEIFESNEQLIKDVLAPGLLFDPGLKSTKVWSAKELKVAGQSHLGAKSSSMLALGRTSKFLSRDMDIIIIDDMEDYDSCREEGQREYSRNKLAEIGTRKVEETCEIYIGSRQHPDDIPNHILQLQGSILQWECYVDSAHDLECDLDPDDFPAHIDCMLFPEVRSYRYLMEKKLEMETLGLGHLYPLRYLNTPIPAEGQVFDVEVIRDVALNRDRDIGLKELPPGYLVGGLDPSARGIQASFLWHYRGDADMPHGVKMSMVDSDEMQSGGVAGAIKIIIHWFRLYDLRLWFYETNSLQIEFYKLVKAGVEKEMVKEFGMNHIVIKEHSTGRNKQDAELGISSMAPVYHSGAIDLPYGTNEARRKVNSLLRQLELWTTDGVANRKAKTDIKMAQWFPFVGKIQDFIKNNRKATLHITEDASYAGISSFTSAPWQNTGYPGRQ